MTQVDQYSTFTQSFHVKEHPSLSTRPWDVEDPYIVQAVAESEIFARDKDLPRIIAHVREASIPFLLGNPAYTPNNFYDDLATVSESSPEGFLEALDRMGPAPLDRGEGRIFWTLPAQGRASTGAYVCGRFLRKKTFGCPQGHEVHAVRCSCHKLSCPVCYPDAVKRMAERMVNTLEPALQLHDGILRPHHVIVSPPQEWAEGLAGTKGGFSYLKGKAWGALERCGSAGASVIFHPYRDSKDGEDVWRIGPHFHAVSVGFIDSSRAPPGWIIKDLGELPTMDRVNLFHLAYYIVSHAGVPEGWGGRYKAVNYFGCFSTAGRKGIAKVGEWTDTVCKKCRTCEGEQYRYHAYLAVAHGGPYRDEDLPPIMERRTYVAWSLRTDAREVKALLDGKGLEDALRISGSDRRIYVVMPEVLELIPSEVDRMAEYDPGSPEGSDGLRQRELWPVPRIPLLRRHERRNWAYLRPAVARGPTPCTPPPEADTESAEASAGSTRAPLRNPQRPPQDPRELPYGIRRGLRFVVSFWGVLSCNPPRRRQGGFGGA